MANTYTYMINDSKREISLEEFAWNCAKAFSPLMYTREDSNAGIKIKFPPDPWYEKCVDRALADLSSAEKFTLEQAARAAQVDYDRAVHDEKVTTAKNAAVKARYEAMLAKALAWQPPTSDHSGLKDFMIEQLTVSMKHDCSHTPYTPVLQSAEEYRADAVKFAQEQVASAKKSHAEHLAHCKFNEAWIWALCTSLGPPPK